MRLLAATVPSLLLKRLPICPLLTLNLTSTANIQSAFTLKEIAASWPYMVETSRATGGGDVPAFEWHVIDEERDFIVEGIRITPLNGSTKHTSSQTFQLSADLFTWRASQFITAASSLQNPHRARHHRRPNRFSRTSASASFSIRTLCTSPTSHSSLRPSGTNSF